MDGYLCPYKVEGFLSSLTGTLRIYAIQKSKSNFFQRRFVSGNRKTVMPNTGTSRQLRTSRCSSETTDTNVFHIVVDRLSPATPEALLVLAQ